MKFRRKLWICLPNFGIPVSNFLAHDITSTIVTGLAVTPMKTSIPLRTMKALLSPSGSVTGLYFVHLQYASAIKRTNYGGRKAQ